MISVVLTVLKILGIIILSVIGLVLVLVLLICISPVRYKVDGKYYDRPDGKLTVSWLLHILHATAGYDGNGLIYKVRVFGIPVLKSKPKSENPCEKAKASTEAGRNPGEKAEASTEAGRNPGEKAEASTEAVRNPDEKAEASTEAVREEKTQDSSENEAKEAGEDSQQAEGEKQPEPDESTSSEEEDEDWLGFIDKMNDAWYEKKEKLFQKLEELEDKVNDIRKKLRLITSERTEAAVKHVLKKVFRILKSIMPRKLRGHVTFGMENPADTGTVLGVLAATLPIHKNQLKIDPVFTEKILEGEAFLKGRISIGFILCCAVGIILNKNVLITIKRFKKHFSKK